MYLGSVKVNKSSYSISCNIDVEGDIVTTTMKQGAGAFGGAVIGSAILPGIGTIVGSAIGAMIPTKKYNINKGKVKSIVERKLSNYGIKNRINDLIIKAIENGNHSGSLSLKAHFTNDELGLSDPYLKEAMNNHAIISIYATW